MAPAFKDLTLGSLIWGADGLALGTVSEQTPEATVVRLYGTRRPITLGEHYRKRVVVRLKSPPGLRLYSCTKAAEWDTHHVAS